MEERQTERGDRRVRRTRQSIRRAFEELSREKDWTRITVRELAERADINRKTFYTYYSGIGDLASSYERDMLDRYQILLDSMPFSWEGFDAVWFFSQIDAMIHENLETYEEMHRIGMLPHLLTGIKDLTIRKFIDENHIVDDAQSYRYLLCADYLAAGVLSMFSSWAVRPDISLEEFIKVAEKISVDGIRGILNQAAET